MSSLRAYRGLLSQGNEPQNIGSTGHSIGGTLAMMLPLHPRIVHCGEYETLADDGAQPGRRLADFRVASEVHSVPEGQHSFVLGAGRVPEVDQAIGQMGQWLRKHLGA